MIGRDLQDLEPIQCPAKLHADEATKIMGFLNA